MNDCSMKRALLLALTFPPDVGGIANTTYQLCKHAKLFKPVVLTTKNLPEALKEEWCGFEVQRYLSAHRTHIQKILFTVKALQFALRVKPEVLVCQTVVDGISGILLSRLLRVPHVVFVYSEELHGPVRPMTRKAQDIVLAAAGKIFANSSYTQGMLLERGVSADKIALLHPGVEIRPQSLSQEVQQMLRQRHGLEGKRVLLTVSRLVPTKGVDTVIEALPRIASEIPNVEYLVVGKGPYAGDFQKLAQDRGVCGKVHFAGHIPDDELPYYYDLCDVFIMMSKPGAEGQKEGFGMALAEAGAYAKPVIGGDCGGTRDAVIDKETGFLVDPHKPEQVARTVLRLLRDKELARRLGQNGRQRAEAELSWRVVTDRFERILLECMAGD